MIVVYLFGLSISMFLFLLTLLKRNKNKSDFVLMGWMGFITIHLALFALDYARVTYDHPHLLGLLLPLPILHGFFLYWYTLETTTNKSLKSSTILLHLIPFVLLVTLAIPFYALSGQEKIEVFLNQGKGFEWYGVIQITLFVVFGFGYSIASIIEVRKHRTRMLNVFSNHEKRKLIWLEWMAIGLACIWLVAFFFDDKIIFSGVVLFVLFIGVFGINQTPVFFTTFDHHRPDDGVDIKQNIYLEEQSSEKYQKSGLTQNDALMLSNSLQHYMEVNKPFKNPDLTLDELAALLKVQPYQLSQVINSQIGKTFYHYINSYRIREFLNLAASPDSKKFTYLALASDCGFQSKTTFNKYFKIETGKTPSEYFQTARAA